MGSSRPFKQGKSKDKGPGQAPSSAQNKSSWREEQITAVASQPGVWVTLHLSETTVNDSKPDNQHAHRPVSVRERRLSNHVR